MLGSGFSIEPNITFLSTDKWYSATASKLSNVSTVLEVFIVLWQNWHETPSCIDGGSNAMSSIDETWLKS